MAIYDFDGCPSDLCAPTQRMTRTAKTRGSDSHARCVSHFERICAVTVLCGSWKSAIHVALGWLPGSNTLNGISRKQGFLRELDT